jgi:hypothetical protein
VAGFAERRKNLVLRIVDEDIAVGEVENARPAVFAGAVPQRIRKLPADLKRDDGLAGAGRERQQHPLPPLQDGLHGKIDGDFLVVAGRLAGEVVVGREQPVADVVGNVLRRRESGPEFRGPGETLQLVIEAGQEIVLDDAVAVRRIGEFEAQDLRVFLGLLKAVARGPVDGLELKKTLRLFGTVEVSAPVSLRLQMA